ncbi:MAG: GNAT family N-acetyltransferase [Solirubrobacterales bacterium]|nr:GNAT family N-acetyltransferase [Solirubrobacterales bacterium]
MPALPNLPAPLRDERVLLRLGAERDIPEILIAHQDDPQMHVRFGQERPPSGAELGRRAEREAHQRAAGAELTLTILEPGSDDCRGQLDVHHLDWDHQRGELGIWVAPQSRGKGLARAALTLAAGWLFGVCGLERLELLTDPDNEPLIRAARAAGFSREGVLRRYRRERGERVDVLVLSLLPGDGDFSAYA